MPISFKEAIARSREKVREDAVIEARASLLHPEDRDVLLAVWTYQQPTRMVAQMCGTTPRALRHRVHMLLDRLHSEEFIGAARIMRFLSPLQAELAQLHFCQGLALRETAATMGIPYHKARNVASEVLGLIKGLRGIRAELRGLGESRGDHTRSDSFGSSGQSGIRGDK